MIEEGDTMQDEEIWTRFACVRLVDDERIPDTSTLCLTRGGALAIARENAADGIGLYSSYPVIGTTLISLRELGEFIPC